MATEQITAKGSGLPENGIEVSFDMPDSPGAATKAWGQEVTLDLINRAARIAVGNMIRAEFKAGKTPEQIQEVVNQWKPGVVRRVSADPLKTLASKMETMDDAQLEAVKARIRVMLGL